MSDRNAKADSSGDLHEIAELKAEIDRLREALDKLRETALDKLREAADE